MPDGATAATPLIVWIHGGGWQGGDKALAQNAFHLRYPRSGYALASINYRLSGEAIFPAQIHDRSVHKMRRKSPVTRPQWI